MRYSRTLLPLILTLIVFVVPLYGQGPIAFYPFNGNANDASGNGHDGSVYGATLTTDRFGKPNSAYNFGGSDFISVPHSPQLVFTNKDDFTIAAWILLAGPQNEFAGIVVKGPHDTYRPGYQFVIRNSDRASTVISNNDYNWSGVIGNTPLTGGCWHLVVLEASAPGSVINMYVDGALDGTTGDPILTPDFDDPQMNPLYIGKERNSSVFFRGKIDDIRIYNRMLSAHEIDSLYHENGWPIGTGVVTQVHQISVCNASAGIQLQAQNGYTDYHWSTGATSRQITVTSPGVYWVQEKSGSGCISAIDSFTVTAKSGVAAIAGKNAGLCPGQSAKIGSPTIPNVTYKWTPVTGLDNPASSNPTASPTTTTKYYLTITDSAGCQSIDSVIVVVGGADAKAGINSSVCGGQSVRIGTPPTRSGLTFNWTPATGLDNPNSATPIAQPKNTTTYHLKVVDSAGCTSEDSVTVSVGSFTANGGGNTSICSGSSVVIGSPSRAGFSYLWSPSFGLSDPTSATPTANPPVTTKYYLTVTDSLGCHGYDSVTVVVGQLLVNAGNAKTICPGQTITLGGGSARPGSRFHWSPGGAMDDSTNWTPSVTPAKTTTYYLSVVDSSGCSGLDSVTVFVGGAVAVAGPTAEVCAGDSVRIGVASRPGYRYSWTPSQGLDNPLASNPMAHPTGMQTYYLTAIDSNGCVARDSVTVSVAPALEILNTDSKLTIVSSDGFTTSCDSITVHNPGTVPLTLTEAQLNHNEEYSIPPSQLPLILGPGESKSIQICLDPSIVGYRRDTLNLLAGCWYKVTLAARIVTTTYSASDICHARLRVKLDTAGYLLRADNAYPNPAREIVSIPLTTVASQDWQMPTTGLLLDEMGNVVGGGSYFPLERRSVGEDTEEKGEIRMDVKDVPQGLHYALIPTKGGSLLLPIIIRR